jgi:hypothetical protein
MPGVIDLKFPGRSNLGLSGSELFIAEFYRLLEDSGNIADALQAAKLKYLSDNREDGLFDATGFQLYIQ